MHTCVWKGRSNLENEIAPGNVNEFWPTSKSTKNGLIAAFLKKQRFANLIADVVLPEPTSPTNIT